MATIWKGREFWRGRSGKSLQGAVPRNRQTPSSTNMHFGLLCSTAIAISYTCSGAVEAASLSEMEKEPYDPYFKYIGLENSFFPYPSPNGTLIISVRWDSGSRPAMGKMRIFCVFEHLSASDRVIFLCVALSVE